MSEAVLDFQEFVSSWVSEQRSGTAHRQQRDDSDDDDLQTRLFELANAPAVAYRCQGGQRITVRQDRTAKVHTGGIVWETAFLLALFLEQRQQRRRQQQQQQRQQQQQQQQQQPATPCNVGARHVLEVGAGCGLLGMVLAAAGCNVVLTEHPIALANLRCNVEACKISSQRARVAQLDWTKESHLQELIAAQNARGCPRCFDTIVGTDVVFSEHLVVPLLNTIHLLSDAKTTVWLCLQERCAAAHKLLMTSIPSYFRSCAQIQSPGAAVEEGCSEEVAAVIEALHGELECVLLKLTGRLDSKAATGAMPVACSGRPVTATRQDQPPQSTLATTETECQEHAAAPARGESAKRGPRDWQKDEAKVHGERVARKKHKN